MENKDSNNKLAPVSQEAETNECLSKEDQNHTVKRKNQQATSRLNEDVSSASQHCTKSSFQWPYAPPPIISQFSKPSVSTTQQTSSVSLNQWHQQQNSTADQQKPFPQMHQPTTPFWLPPGPGFPVIRAPAPSGYQCIVPVGTTEASLRHDPLASSLSYQAGFPPPMGFSGTWDPASWWGQPQQSHPPYTFPGPYGYFQLAPPVFPETPVTFGGSNQRGIIQPSAKLSKKHQLMWDSQSSENVQMWAAITKVQTEMTTYGSRLAKVEAEVSSIKSTLEEYSGAGAGTTTAGQSMKRGRPKKVASAEVLPFMEESQPRARARKIISCKPQSENIFLHGKKERLLSHKEKTFQAAAVDGANIQQEIDGKISGISTNTIELNESNVKVPLDVKTTPTVHDKVNQEIQGGGFSLNFTKEINGTDCRSKNKKTGLSFQAEQVTGTNSIISSTNFKEQKGNGNHGWVSNVLPDDCGRNLLEIRSHTFYDTGSVSVIRQGGEVVPGWSFVNEGNPTEEDVGMLLRSGNDEEEDTSTGDDEMAHRGCM
ncbi:hypothetical protein C5167_037277 [Papaver somniferum]|uniref:Uncharacterized protein n=1 Tax=Papaver somniferum TaxID=3469 RepID=A0A4Y7I5W0_PAPSO|nr:uncharacterized protein LOC113302000 [Papaver somniferum]RZC44323.1 hypothetical protein C5167_037277 [Papaver somniferum]